MRVFLSTRQFIHPFKGGVDVYADRLGKALQRQGHVVSYLAFDLKDGYSAEEIAISKDDYRGSRIWRFTLTSSERHDATFQLGYDHQMGEAIQRILSEERAEILIILNFYLSTLASVEAASRLGIPISHIATDFIPVCRRATLIKWDGRPCESGESIRACSACFVSQRKLGRYTAGLLGQLPKDRLIELANREANAGSGNPIHQLHPYFKQILLMEKRIEILRPLRKKINHVFAPTKFTANSFVSNGFQIDRVSVLPFAVEETSPLTQIEHLEAQHVRFLFIGRIQPYKGVHLLVDAFNRISNPRGATLDIFGVPDGYDDYFQSLEGEINKNERIRFRGRIDPQDLASAFSDTDYFILPSIWHENSPLIFLDALQARTPVIASDIGGVSDLLVDGQNGFLFPMGDTEALTAILEKVVTQPSIRDQLQPDLNLPSIDDYAAKVMALSIPSLTSADHRPSPS